MGKKGCTHKRNRKKDRAADIFDRELERFLSGKEIREALARGNAGKRGAPFKIPDAAVEWAARMIVSRRLTYSAAAAAVDRAMGALGFGGISKSQLWKRVHALKVHDGTSDVNDGRVLAFGRGARPRGVPVTAAADSTGISPDPPSGWMVEHWDRSKARGWYKLHVLSDTDTGEILSYVFTEPEYGDSLAFGRLVDLALEAGHSLEMVYADAAYDAKAHWNRMKELGIGFIANPRVPKDLGNQGRCRGRSRGCVCRMEHIRRISEVGAGAWKEEVGYGRRWRVEGTFSDLKRMFGDTLRARTAATAAALIGWIVRCFNRFKEIRWNL